MIKAPIQMPLKSSVNVVVPPLRRARRAFTLVEVLVALGIFFLLLGVLFVPLRLAFDSLNIGRAQSAAQQAAQATVLQVEGDLKRAIYVFPNRKMIGVFGNKAPYTLSKDTDDTGQPKQGICTGTTNVEAWNNQSRIDLLLPQMSNGTVKNPVVPERYLVSYYPRRIDLSLPFDPIDNPIVLFRAQVPFRRSDNDNDFAAVTVPSPGPASAPGSINADVSDNRIPPNLTTCGANAARWNRSSLWLTHNFYGEANLEPMAVDAPNDVFGAHTLATPRGMALWTPRAADPTSTSSARYQPDSTFFCEDANRDGVIDQVTINLILANYSTANEANANGTLKGQVARYSRRVALPNVR